MFGRSIWQMDSSAAEGQWKGCHDCSSSNTFLNPHRKGVLLAWRLAPVTLGFERRA